MPRYVVAFVLCLISLSVVFGAESVSTDSIDYRLQGEYTGLGRGVQVVARGDGKFEASTIPGGLPGAGGETSGRITVKGKTNGERVDFTFPDGMLIVEPESASWQSHAGEQLGVLPKVRRQSPTMGLTPPSHAERLFVDGKIGELDSAKLSPEGFLVRGAITKKPVEDFRLHVEFRTPFTPKAGGQGRGNSGLYIQRRYEVQILDSFGHPEGEANECGGLYRQMATRLNMALPPMTWQTYDIWFRQARFTSEGHKYAPAEITVVHNGVTVHDRYRLVNKTGAGQNEGPNPLPLLFQDHGDDVVYRNVWLVRGETEPHAVHSPIFTSATGPVIESGSHIVTVPPGNEMPVVVLSPEGSNVSPALPGLPVNCLPCCPPVGEAR